MPHLSSNSHEIDISRSNAPLHIKFALVCLNRSVIPKWLGIFFFILSHLQIIALLIKSAYIALPDDTPNVSPVIKLFVKLFVVGDWWNHGNTVPLLVGTLIITLYVVKVLGLMVYIHVCLFKKHKIPNLIQSYWSSVHRLHPFIFFFWIHTFCNEIIKYSHDYDDFNKPVETFMTAMAYFNTVINCVLAVLFSIISVISKTNDVLSSKTNILETKAVLFKIIVPILWSVAENNKGMQILTLVLSLLNAISQDWVFIKYLPYYRVKILLISAVFQAMETSLALVTLIVKLFEERTGVFSAQIVWLLTLPIFVKLYYAFTWKILLYIFGCEIKKERNVYYLIHKRFILLYFLKKRKAIHPGINQFSHADILYQARLSEVAVESDYSPKELDFDKKLLVRCLKTICLEVLSRNPRAFLAQMNLANSFSNFEDLYLVSNNLLADAISKGPGYQEQISLNLIHLGLQKRLKAQFSQNTGDGLNVYSYITNQELHEEMKKCIEEQAKIQLSFWNEFMSSEPKMLKLMNIASEVNSQKRIIKRLWNDLMKIRPSSFISPLTLYGMYLSFINNNHIEGGKYIEQSQEETQKMNKALKADELNNETMFSEKCVKITMSGLRSSLGKIIDCSPNVTDFYGWQGSDMKGRPIGTLMSPSFRQRHDGFLMSHFNTGKTRIMNKTRILPVKRSNGYIHPSWIHAKVSPFLDHGIFYIGIVKPCKSSLRMVLVKKDGKIDDMSFEFAKDMNLTEADSDIFTLCPEFKQINEAYNMIAEDSIEKSPIEKNENEALSYHQNNLVINTFQQNKKNAQKTVDSLVASEREESTTRMTERPLFFKDKNKRNIDDETLSTENGVERFNYYKSAFSKKAQSIYDTFITGSPLVFHSRNSRDSIIYNVKIMNSIHGNEVIKFVLLEKTSGEDNESDEEKDLFSSEIPPSAKVYNSHIEIETERVELVNSITSPRATTRFKSTESPNHETYLSIGDEVQNSDFAAKKAITRNVLHDNNQTKSAFFAEENQNTKRKTLIHHQEEDHKTRLRRLKEKLKNPVINAAQIENSVSLSYVSKGKKVEQMVVQALKGEPKKRSAAVFTSFSILFLILMIVLLFVQNLNLISGIHDVQAQVPVIKIALLRQYNMIYSASMIRQWKGILEGTWTRDWESDNIEFPSYLIYYTYSMSYYNTEFYQLLAQLPEKMQMKSYEKNVGMYEYDENGNKTALISMGSTFEAFQVLLEKENGCLNMEIPDHYIDGIDISDFKFVVDNAMNDLLIQSENQIIDLGKDLNDSTSSTTLKISLTLGVVLAACFIFTLVSIRCMWLIAKEAKIFMILIFRIKLQECEAIQVILQHFISALDRDLVIQEKAKVKVEQEDIDNHSLVRFRRASMTSLLRSQRVAFLKLLPIFILFICWSVLYFFLTSNFIGDIKDTQKRMETALQGFNTQGLLVYEMLTIPLTNANALIRNEPILPSYLESLNNIKQIDEFVNRFRDRNGKLTALQEKVLFGFPCEDFLPIMARSEQSYEDYIYSYDGCVNMAKGKDSIGLVYLYSEFYNNGRFLLEQFEASNKTKEALGELFLTMLGLNYDLINTAEGFIALLYEATDVSFSDQVESIRRVSWWIAACIVVVTLVAIWVTWKFVMKGIFGIQKIDWLILQIIPIQLILGNKYIQHYLLKHLDGRFDNVKSYL